MLWARLHSTLGHNIQPAHTQAKSHRHSHSSWRWYQGGHGYRYWTGSRQIPGGRRSWVCAAYPAVHRWSLDKAAARDHPTTKCTTCTLDSIRRSPTVNPRCHTASKAAARSTRTVQAASPAQQPPMSCASRATWSTPDRPRRKPACSWGRWGPMMGRHVHGPSPQAAWMGRTTARRACSPQGRLRARQAPWRATTAAPRHTLGTPHFSKQVDTHRHSHLTAASPTCKRNSGWTPSGPGALPTPMDLSASTSLPCQMGPTRSHPRH